MNSERIKEIQETTAHPDSKSVQQALLQVWNECQQEKVEKIKELQLEVEDYKFRLIECMNELQLTNGRINDYELEVIELKKNINNNAPTYL